MPSWLAALVDQRREVEVDGLNPTRLCPNRKHIERRKNTAHVNWSKLRNEKSRSQVPTTGINSR